MPRLRGEGVVYFPIRHHSPACAEHVRKWIAENRPSAVLVEGPRSFDRFLNELLDARSDFPLAVYTHFVDTRRQTLPAPKDGGPEGEASESEPPRFAAFYPLCDYSPELAALRAGREAGARLRFIDLDFGAKTLAEFAARCVEEEEETPVVRVESLAADPHLAHSRYVRELARRFGMRDFDELWDHLFESGAASLSTDAFVDRLASYCAIARLEYADDDLRRDGTTAREAAMAAAVREELARSEEGDGPVLVITGGFHTAALPELVASDAPPAPPALTPSGEEAAWLVAYSFPQLDSLAGYSSGMPSPGFYERMWRAGQASDPTAARTREAAEIVLEVARLTRERDGMNPLSTPDAVAAVQSARRLAALRGHPWPQREDLLDGVRSCFVKGEIGSEGYAVMRLVAERLTGDRIGRTPPGAEAPAIVDDFRRQCERLRVPTDSVEPKTLTLELYRNRRHRRISRLLHRLDLLAAPLAVFEGGPDFLEGTGLDLMHERWSVRWAPAVEAALVEASVFGPTVEAAAAAKLDASIAELEASGQGRSASAAVALLVRTCRLGLQRRTDRILAGLGRSIHEDPSLPSVAAALTQLELLATAREPLEARGLEQTPRLVEACYQRACALADGAVACPDEMVVPVIDALRSLRESLVGERSDSSLDPELFHQALQRVVASAPDKSQGAVVGAAAGLLYLEGRLTAEPLGELIAGFLGASTVEPARRCAVVRGLLATAREAAWRVSPLVDALDTQLCGWDESQFVASLPELRLAFADLTPTEIVRVAERAAARHDEADLGELVLTDLSEADALMAAQIAGLVREQLAAERFDSAEAAHAK
ncbi:DUF5682 family protein [Pseudobythopirellula maris]|uniref:DUF5682 family protein n=1 Tax=Pseudobythopirellula maris TaxID=2527991 RepID=UPI0011B60281|nr:DUF5682 family protein [Pseudobythopirellula maris]